MESSTDDNKLDFILERESALAKMQFITSELRRDNEALKEENRQKLKNPKRIPNNLFRNPN